MHRTARFILSLLLGASGFLPSAHADSACSRKLGRQWTADRLHVGIVQYPLARAKTIGDWEKKIRSFLAQADAGDAQVVVFPELIALEGLSLIPGAEADPAGAMRSLATTITPHFVERFKAWSREFGLYILAGSWPVVGAGAESPIHNAAFLFSPDGELVLEQRKNHLTHDEDALYHWTGAAGGMRHFRLPNGTDVGVAICFDSEFPNFISTSDGIIPEVVLVPSMTSDAFGRYRVRRAASARAVEQHAYVVVTGTVGGEAGDPLIGAHEGQAIVFAPSDRLFPPDGVLAAGDLNRPQVLFVELDLKRLRESRKMSTTFPAKILQESGGRR